MKMTEEEARKKWKSLAFEDGWVGAVDVHIRILRDMGIITRPAWEEVEEKYQKWLLMPKDTVSDYYSMVYKFHDALTAAVERIKELENENK